MDGKTHKKFAPVFTLGATLFLIQTPVVNNILPPIATILISSLASTLTSTAPDADVHAYKPMTVIWGGRGNKDTQGNYLVWGKDGKLKKYKTPRSKSIKVWATFFRLLGVTEHRDYRSHSPIIWVPLWYILFKATEIQTKSLGELGAVMSVTVLGMGLGFLSHLVGDVTTKSGLPTLPVMKDFSPVKLLPKFLQQYFKSGGSFLNFAMMFGAVNLILYLVLGDLLTGFYTIIFNIVLGVFNMIITVIKATIGSN